MKRRRRWVWMKWGGLTASLLLVVVWVVSEFWTFGYGGEHVNTQMFPGALAFAFGLEPGLDRLYGWFVFPDIPGGEREWLPLVVTLGGSPATCLLIPLWLPLAILTPITVIAWRKARRPLPGHCECSYDLTGNESGICPECGEKLDGGE